MNDNFDKDIGWTPIVVAFTPNYFVPAATCLYSIFANSDKAYKFHVICLLSEDLPDRMKENIQLIGGDRAHYSYINLQGKLEHIHVDPIYSVATLYRLLLPDLLPEYDTILYIDCDVIVRNDLGKLYDSLDIGNNYLGAVYEAALDFQEAHFKEIGCNPGNYFNAGFLIMNLRVLRQDGMSEKFIDLLNKTKLEFWDQDALNILCKDRILALPPIYNSIRTFFLPQYKHFFLKRYTQEDLFAVHKNGTIHYTGSKPWNSFTVEFKVWWEYYKQLPVEIRREGLIDNKIHLLYRIYKTRIGGWAIKNIQSMYRKMRVK